MIASVEILAAWEEFIERWIDLYFPRTNGNFSSASKEFIRRRRGRIQWTHKIGVFHTAAAGAEQRADEASVEEKDETDKKGVSERDE